MTSHHETVAEFRALGERMKELERDSFCVNDKGDLVLPVGEMFMARLDGHCFSNYVRGLAGPFDRRFAAAMRRTALDLMKHFNNVYTCYTHSDEISLIFVPIHDEETGAPRPWAYNGRVHKLNSLLASLAAARFNFHMVQNFEGVEPGVQVANEAAACAEYADNGSLGDSSTPLQLFETHTYSDATLRKVRSHTAIFDSRLFVLKTTERVRDCLLWRQQFDCRRNSVHGLARAIFSTKQLHACSVPKQLEMLKEKNVDYSQADQQFRCGVFGKKELFELHTTNPKDNSDVICTRSRIRTFFKVLSADSTDIDWLVAKYFAEDSECN